LELATEQTKIKTIQQIAKKIAFFGGNSEFELLLRIFVCDVVSSGKILKP